MTDLDLAQAKAGESVERVKDAAKEALSRFHVLCDEVIVLAGVTSRAQGFHEGISRAVGDGNPYAAFTLLRSYAENAAAIAYLADKPQELRQFIYGGSKLTSGRLLNHADKHFLGYRAIFNTLNDYVHPAARSTLASQYITKHEDGMAHFHWHSAPSFRSETEHLMACAWQWELAEAHDHLLRRLGRVLHERYSD